MVIETIPQLAQLTPAQKLTLIDELWEELEQNPDTLPIPDWHKRILDQAEAEYLASPDEGSPAEEVFERLRQRFQ